MVIKDIPKYGIFWKEFLKKYKLINVEGPDNLNDFWKVSSISGNTYEVKQETKIDPEGNLYFKMNCNCPARKRCRHINAVIQMRYWIASTEPIDTNDMETLEKILLD